MGQAESISNYFIAPREFIEMYATLLSSVEGSGRLTIYHVSEIRRSELSQVLFFLWFIASRFAHSPGWPHRLSSSESCTMRSSSSLPLSTHFLCNQESSQDLLRIRIHWTQNLWVLKEVVPGSTTLNRYLNSWSQKPFNRDNPLVESGRKTRVFKDYAAAVLSFVPSPLNQL